MKQGKMMAPGGFVVEGLQARLNAAERGWNKAERILSIIRESGAAGAMLVNEATRLAEKHEVGV